jgi:prepilin-type N-terminal cleavage/methylation domain-containing protein
MTFQTMTPFRQKISKPSLKRFHSFGQRGFTLAELLVALAMTGLILSAVVTLYYTGNGIYQAGANQAQAMQGSRISMAMIQEDLRLAGYGFPSVTGQLKITTATPTSITFWADLTNRSTSLSANVNAGDTTLNVGGTAGLNAGDNVFLINGGQWERRTVVSKTASTITVSVASDPWKSSDCPCSFPLGAQVGRPKSIAYVWNAGTLTKDDGEGGGPQIITTGVPAFQLTYFGVVGTDNDASITSPSTNLANIRRIQIQMTSQSTGEQVVMTSDIRPRNIP